ncbi:DUF433 domain-containing protein [Hymenobacter convexus]|uniref:DUF433 domain-containing protein n=1 Tax=Hymenobacter sp. CA1UV-4 TaxID=3063782 RepID=UPI002712C42A|nr:DUF433 domain-containing protein [Hymenobacter sp. CA1UV-4]MDO7851524.1 DUF433 domain-containing protein [Hymenobacter sp. CA1UV-4]
MATANARITASHEIMLGKPVIRGTRLTVELLLRKLAEGATTADLLAMYPQLEAADVQAALEYAAAMLAKEEIIGFAA